MKKIIAIASIAIIAVVGLAACQGGANQADQRTSATILGKYQQSQPAPTFDWSQLRQTLIDIETAQAHATQTTSFFMNFAPDPVSSCPSIGFPVPTTDQITNPQQQVGQGGTGAIAQIDPNGVFSGQSSGTYVLCVNPQGQTYGVYWEGNVLAVGGPAKWDTTTHQAVLVGAPTAKFTTKP